MTKRRVQAIRHVGFEDLGSRRRRSRCRSLAADAEQSDALRRLHGPLFERPAVHATVDDLLRATAEKRLEVVIDRVFPLRDAAMAHAYAETAKPLGRVVMTTSR